MAGGISNTAANKFYNALTGKGTWTTADLFVSLSTADATDDDGASIAEFTGVPNGTNGRLTMSGTWTVDNNSGATYDSELDWGIATGSASGVKALAFWNANTGTAGSVFEGWTTMGTDKDVAIGNAVKILTGLIDIDFASGKTAGLHLLDAAINQAVAAWVGNTTWTAANLWLGLLSTAPTDDEGASAVEVTGVFPAGRIEIPNADWASPSNGSGLLTQAVDFGTATGATGANDIIGYGLFSASSGGSLLGYQVLTDGPVDITIGDTYAVPANEITLDCQG